ncbi:hypothetical protein CPB84DRAFT_1847686 [Gymnopilus junonius]|uniref:Uncharacterized protein n=1 Tax=Gymnopilus junonius TaxID=109634 RepID=A0A9P5NLP9_GYMJU|nr:hypothetical protein CPB84DRAFT_1847686 [Gymnopilus junonius]
MIFNPSYKYLKVVNVNLCGTGSNAPPAAFSCPHSHQGPMMELGAAAECPAAPDAAMKAERTQEPAEEEEILSEMEPNSQAPGYQYTVAIKSIAHT